MKVRSLLTGAVAVTLLGVGFIATSARAEETIDADVGGGVAGIQAHLEIGSPLFNYLNKDFVEADIVTPRAVLDKDGHAASAGAANRTVGPVNVKAIYEQIRGNRAGHPSFATAESTLTGITIGTTKIQALDVTCTWERNRDQGGTSANPARGHTTVVEAGGVVRQPAPNTTRVIPGLGTLVLNEQYIESTSRRDPSLDTPTNPYGYRYFPQIIYVYGAHLYLDKAAQGQYGIVDIILGFTSCDPVQLPKLSTVKLGATPSD